MCVCFNVESLPNVTSVVLRAELEITLKSSKQNLEKKKTFLKTNGNVSFGTETTKSTSTLASNSLIAEWWPGPRPLQ